jgi:hypothetical protein
MRSPSPVIVANEVMDLEASVSPASFNGPVYSLALQQMQRYFFCTYALLFVVYRMIFTSIERLFTALSSPSFLHPMQWLLH